MPLSSFTDRAAVPAGPERAPARVPWSLGQRLRDVLRPMLLPNHYPALHGLRVLAIVLVVQLHATTALLVAGLVSFSTMHLWFGMDLFFLLSGFLIGSMLLEEDSTGRRVDMLRFYLRRTFRIVPSYLVVLTALATAFPMLPLMRANLWKEYLYLTNYVPPLPGLVVMPWGWSLALEEHFYLVVPVLVMLLRALRSTRAQLWTLVALWLSGLGMRLAAIALDGPWDPTRALAVMYVQTHLRYDILIAGIFTACVHRNYRERLSAWFRYRSVRSVFWAISLLAFAALIFTVRLQQQSMGYAALCWGTITSLAYVPLVLLLINHQGVVARLLSKSFFRFVATFGYGIYLVHVPVIHLVWIPIATTAHKLLGLPWQVLWPSTIVGALSVSTLIGHGLHVLIEKPALKLRDRVSP